MPRKVDLRTLKADGFDRSRRSGKHIMVRCSCCEALVINGVPSHECGCQNATINSMQDEDYYDEP